MGVESLLTRLITYGKSNGITDETGDLQPFFVFEELGKIDKSCCTTATTEIIDFDLCKETIVKKINSSTIKSCDALKILPSKQRIDFIELKGFKKFIEWQLSKEEDTNKAIQAKIEKFDFPSKIYDSLHLVDCILREKDFKFTVSERKDFLNVEKQFIIVVDIDIDFGRKPFEAFLKTINVLSKLPTPRINLVKKQIKRNLQSSLRNIPDNQLARLRRPILKTCDNIDAYYN